MLGTPLKRAFAVCRNGVAHGKQAAVCRVPGQYTRQKMAPLPCALALAHGKGVFQAVFLLMAYIWPQSNIQCIVHIYVNTNPNNIRYKSIQYSNQIHTIVDTNPYNRRYNSIQQSIQYHSPNAELHIVDTVVHTIYSPYTSRSAIQSSCYSRGRRRWRRRRRPRWRLRVALRESHPHCCGILLRRHVLIDWPIIGRRRLRLHIIIEDIICVSQDQSLLVIISKSLFQSHCSYTWSL